ncbi:site-specific integrase [Priestia megaterium]|uniref:site-specific integrase n=1 Tax=Priestia megaterium TaxID=1404 RepID=UPI001C492DC0|nr:site-specific integrase [Priestia megaterium]MBV6734528.1 site-specific integrase [Priestia megaterium]
MNELREEEFLSISEEKFSREESFRNVLRILEGFEEQFIAHFDDNIWIFVGWAKHRKIFDFNKLKQYTELEHTLGESLIVTVKCWVGEMLQDFSLSTVKFNYSLLLEGLEKTQGFKKDNVDSFINYLTKDLRDNTTKASLIRSLLNFFDYSDIEYGEYYIKPLITYRSKLPYIKKSISLPPSKDVLTLSWCIESYFAELLKQESSEKNLAMRILYYPILIWWKLTNVIPLRAGEFCCISRNSLFKNNKGKPYIKLPRQKLPHNSTAVVDKIEISDDLYTLIFNYISMTEGFGETQVLFSYRAIIWADSQNRINRKYDINTFTKQTLAVLIKRFYKDIVKKKYGLNIEKENQVKPNQTRHFAIISLVMQGISPVEIARLANHKTVSMQYHYAHHIEHWIDCEVFNLMNKFKFISHAAPFFINEDNNSKKEVNILQHIPDEIRLKAFQPPTSDGCYKPLQDIGYCSDQLQRCETDQCIFCSHWRIEPHELIENNNVIKEKIKERKRNIGELANFIEKIHEQIFVDELYSQNPVSFNHLKTASNQIKEEINQIAELKILEGVGYRVQKS